MNHKEIFTQPVTIATRCPTMEYAEGVLLGINQVLSVALGTNNIIMRKQPYIQKYDDEYLVRARFQFQPKIGERGCVKVCTGAFYIEEDISV